MKKISLYCFAIYLFFGLTPAFAGGGQSYPNGAEGFLSGAVPPPGFYLIDYLYNYSSDSMKDNKGDDIEAFDDISVWANVFRFLWVSDNEILGANLAMHTFIPVLDVDIDFKAPAGPDSKSSYNDTGVPYVIVNPLILAWHLNQGKLHIVATPADIYVPVGQDDGNLASIGQNFWTFEPIVAVTYLHDKWEFSSKFMYDFNTTEKKSATIYGFEVDRDPGQEFHFDYSVSYALTPSFRAGINGYYYIQTTDDSYDLNDSIPAPVQDLLNDDEDNRSRVFAAGPGLWYNHKNMFLSLRSQIEMGAKNKTEGINVWAKFTYAF